MDRAVLKGLVRTLKALILELEAEVFADKEAYTKPRENYDDPIEYYNSNDDDDGYADWLEIYSRENGSEEKRTDTSFR